MTVSEFWISIIAGVISGVFSTGIFSLFMSKLRPNITISSEICKNQDQTGTFYGFKILNNSKVAMLDLRAEVILMSPFNSNGGANHFMQWIKLRRDNILIFSGYKKSDAQGNYALIIATRDNLEELWSKDSQHLVIKIHGKHPFSGMSRSFEQKYYTKKNCIKEGLFNFGKTFEIS